MIQVCSDKHNKPTKVQYRNHFSFSGLPSYLATCSRASLPPYLSTKDLLFTYNTSCLSILDPIAPLKEKQLIPETSLWLNDPTRVFKRKVGGLKGRGKKYVTNLLKLSKPYGFLWECSTEARNSDFSSLVVSSLIQEFFFRPFTAQPSTCSVFWGLPW